MTKSIWSFFLGSLLLLFVSNSRAQLHFNYTVSDGLASNTVFYIFQDNDKYLWFGTNQGVSRYNGQEFENFNTLNGLGNDEVFVITQGPQKNIWFGTRAPGLCYFNNDSIYEYKYNQSLIEKYPNKSVKLSIAWDSHKNLLLGDAIYSLIRISENGEISDFGAKGKNVFEVENTLIASIQRELRKKEGFRPGIKRLNFTKVNVNGDTAFLEYREMTDRYSTTGSHYTFRLNKDSIAVINDELLTIISGDSFAIEIMPFRTDCIFKDSKKRIWIGTRENGVFIYNKLDFKKPVANLLNGYTVTHVIEDFQGGIWCSTLEKGVFHFPSIESVINQKYELPKKEISELIKKDESSFFVRYLGGKIYYLKDGLATLISDLPKTFDEEDNFLFYDSIREVAHVKNILPGVENKFSFGFKKIPLFSEVEPKSLCFYYFIDPTNHIWDFRGLGIYSKKLNISRVEIRHSNIYNIVMCARHYNDTNWVGTLNGLYTINSDGLAKYTKRGMASPRISSMDVYKEEMAMTMDGIGVLIMRKDKTIILKDKKLIKSLKFNSIRYDREGNLFFSNADGLFFAKKENDFIIQKVSNQQVNFSIANDILNINNDLYVGSVEGLIQLPREVFNEDVVTPKSHIRIKLVNDKKYDGNKTTLDYNENSLEIEFSSIDYAEKTKPLFAWMIEGVDQDWHYTKNPSLYLNRLSHGSYKILLKSSVVPSHWSEQVSIEFEIKPPFWLTWWFFSLTGTSFIGLVLCLFYFRGKALKKKAEKNLRILQEKNELENKALRAQMNPHFVFNTMTAIQNLIQSKKNEKAEYFLIKFSHLMRLIVDKSQESHISLKDDLEQLISYIDLQNLRFKMKFSFNIKLPEEIDTSTIIIPSMILQPFVENAIEHGISKSDRKGELLIRFEVKDSKLIVCIEDNGIGRKKAKELSSRLRKKHKSVGMSNVSKRLKILSDAQGEENSVSVTDIRDSENKVCGTKVLITLKLQIK